MVSVPLTVESDGPTSTPLKIEPLTPVSDVRMFELLFVPLKKTARPLGVNVPVRVQLPPTFMSPPLAEESVSVVPVSIVTLPSAVRGEVEAPKLRLVPLVEVWTLKGTPAPLVAPAVHSSPAP